MPLDPIAKRLLAMMAAASPTGQPRPTPNERRQSLAKLMRFADVDVAGVAAVDGVLPGPAGDIAYRLYVPGNTAGEASPGFLFFHGGGMVAGSIETHDGPARAFAKRAGIVVVSVDYRLAPEHPFPAAIDDAWAATSWVASHAEELKLDSDRIGVGGDSAGGTLAAVVSRRARDHAVPIALQLLLYPVTNSSADTPSYSLYSSGYGLTRDGMEWFWKQYLGEGGDETNPDASPAQLTDLRRLPRAIVVTAEADILRDEAEAYAQRLFLATVETEGYRYDGMIHGFMRMAGKVERANEAYDELAESITTMLAKTWRA